MTRNKTAEILELKSRKEFETYWKVSERLKVLETAISQVGEDSANSREFLKHIPVALVSLMESFFRSTLIKFIETDEQYLANAKKLFEDNKIKIDFDILQNIQKHEFNIGEVISHHISFSKFENITEVFKTLFNGKNFIEELMQYAPSKSNGERKANAASFVSHKDRVITELKKMFALRNIICHEMAQNTNVSKADALEFYKATRIFVIQVKNYSYDLLFPDVLVTDPVKIKAAKEAFLAMERELEDLINGIKQKPLSFYGEKIDIDSFLESHELWKRHRDLLFKSLQKDYELYKVFYAVDYYTDLKEYTFEQIDFLKAQFGIESE